MSDVEKVSAKGILVWAICSLFYLYEFLLRTILGTFQHPIMADLQLNVVQFTLLSSTAYLFVYGLMQIPVGMIVDKFGLKMSLLTAIILCAVANLGFASTHSYPIAILFRIMMGLGSSFGFIGLLVAVYDWMPRRNIALFIGCAQFVGTMGPMLAGGPLNALSEASIVNWRGVFSMLAVMGGVIACLILFFVDKNRQNKGIFQILARPTATLKNIRLIVSQPQIWLIAIFGAFVYFSLEYLSENEGKAFLIEKGFSSSFSSYMITLAWFGFAVGSPILGFVSDKIQRRKPILLFSAAATFLSLACILYMPFGKLLTAGSFILLGAGIGASSVGIVILGEQCKSTYLAAGLGLNNAITMLFVSIAAPIVGSILSSFSLSSPYSLHDYRSVFIILAAMPFISILIILFGIRETFCKPTKENIILKTKD